MPLTVSSARADSLLAHVPKDLADRRWVDRLQGAGYGLAAAALMPVCLGYDSVCDVARGLRVPEEHGLVMQGAFEGMAAATTVLCLPATLPVGCMLGATLGFRSIRYVVDAPMLSMRAPESSRAKVP